MSEPQRKSIYLVIEDDQIVLRTNAFSEAADLRNSRLHAYIAAVIVGSKHDATKEGSPSMPQDPSTRIKRIAPAGTRSRRRTSSAARRPA